MKKRAGGKSCDLKDRNTVVLKDTGYKDYKDDHCHPNMIVPHAVAGFQEWATGPDGFLCKASIIISELQYIVNAKQYLWLSMLAANFF